MFSPFWLAQNRYSFDGSIVMFRGVRPRLGMYSTSVSVPLRGSTEYNARLSWPGLARRERCPGVLIGVERFAQPAICLDTVQRERTACVGNRAGQFAARVEHNLIRKVALCRYLIHQREHARHVIDSVSSYGIHL